MARKIKSKWIKEQNCNYLLGWLNLGNIHLVKMVSTGLWSIKPYHSQLVSSFTTRVKYILNTRPALKYSLVLRYLYRTSLKDRQWRFKRQTQVVHNYNLGCSDGTRIWLACLCFLTRQIQNSWQGGILVAAPRPSSHDQREGPWAALSWRYLTIPVMAY